MIMGLLHVRVRTWRGGGGVGRAGLTRLTAAHAPQLRLARAEGCQARLLVLRVIVIVSVARARQDDVSLPDALLTALQEVALQGKNLF